MGFHLSFGIGPLRYTKSLSGGRRRSRPQHPNRADRQRQQAVTDIRRDILQVQLSALELSKLRSEADTWGFALLTRIGWTLRYRCDNCGRPIAAGAKSHVCENISGWSWSENVTTRLMDGDREVVTAAGFHGAYDALAITSKVSPEVSAVEMTDDEEAEFDRLNTAFQAYR